MRDEPAADLGLIARQQRQMLAEIGTMRDDMAAMTAMLRCLDGTAAGLVNEVRAMHGRVRALEERGP